MTKLYKLTHPYGACVGGGTGVWPLPNGHPGAWLEASGPLVPCQNGLHLCEVTDLVNWIAPALWEAEYEGESIRHEGTKTVVRRARLIKRVDAWNDRNLRLFACECAERALDAEEKAGRKVDPRSRAVVEVARRYARGNATAEELAAAWEAAWAAAWAAAGAAAAAARAAAWEAAWAAADAAAAAAAWEEAGAAARAAERDWQAKRLVELCVEGVEP